MGTKEKEEHADLRAHLEDLRHQINVKDTQIAALLERIREANAIAIQQQRPTAAGN